MSHELLLLYWSPQQFEKGKCLFILFLEMQFCKVNKPAVSKIPFLKRCVVQRVCWSRLQDVKNVSFVELIFLPFNMVFVSQKVVMPLKNTLVDILVPNYKQLKSLHVFLNYTTDCEEHCHILYCEWCTREAAPTILNYFKTCPQNY